MTDELIWYDSLAKQTTLTWLCCRFLQMRRTLTQTDWNPAFSLTSGVRWTLSWSSVSSSPTFGLFQCHRPNRQSHQYKQTWHTLFCHCDQSTTVCMFKWSARKEDKPVVLLLVYYISLLVLLVQRRKTLTMEQFSFPIAQRLTFRSTPPVTRTRPVSPRSRHFTLSSCAFISSGSKVEREDQMKFRIDFRRMQCNFCLSIFCSRNFTHSTHIFLMLTFLWGPSVFLVNFEHLFNTFSH